MSAAQGFEQLCRQSAGLALKGSDAANQRIVDADLGGRVDRAHQIRRS
jgi:hypothetical protein